ncbi:NAD(P)-dependent dehydrogenase (short-subunit alcohol dehydrogenase family) [Paraburkholderia sp. GAS333]|uniref:SDR family NAD(P)-dependent oxidoreductase n=1 Tax=Paraburkholderia sp. GAS333 TaxID=3156279 RepID=UPI003D2114D3
MTIDKHTVALVTGADRGLGAKFVEVLLAQGAGKIYAAMRRPAEHPAYPADSRVVPLQLDVTDASQVEAAARIASDVTLLINNAGVNFQAGALSASQPDSARREMEVNYFATLSMAQAFSPQLIAARGAMVNILSILARITLAPMTTLCASKAAALRLSEGLDAELAPHGVRVFAVMPGAIDTDMSRDYEGDKLSTDAVVHATLAALDGGEREVYVGQMANDVARMLAADRLTIQTQIVGARAASAG